ncbi:MAG: hypothetical protein C4333_04005 [Meiothermus sp.]
MRRLILDGVGLYSDAEQAEMLARYAPAMRPDLHAAHLMWVWHFVRDTFVFWPWYKTDAAHRRPTGLPSAEALHEKVVEVLKALTTYHKSYRAAFLHDLETLWRAPYLSPTHRSRVEALWNQVHSQPSTPLWHVRYQLERLLEA